MKSRWPTYRVTFEIRDTDQPCEPAIDMPPREGGPLAPSQAAVVEAVSFHQSDAPSSLGNHHRRNTGTLASEGGWRGLQDCPRENTRSTLPARCYHTHRGGAEAVLASERVERRLTAILAADVAGYSRLTGFDEEGTHARLQDHLRSLVDPKIAEHRGRVVKNTGDGMLAEFGSVVDAVRCAVDVQRGMLERNANVPQEKRIEFRIGINVGDIILDRGDIFGDGVNVAARLEAVAEPSGICVSGRALEDIEGKLDIGFEDAGEQRLKN